MLFPLFTFLLGLNIKIIKIDFFIINAYKNPKNSQIEWRLVEKLSEKTKVPEIAEDEVEALVQENAKRY